VPKYNQHEILIRMHAAGTDWSLEAADSEEEDLPSKRSFDDFSSEPASEATASTVNSTACGDTWQERKHHDWYYGMHHNASAELVSESVYECHQTQKVSLHKTSAFLTTRMA